MTTTDRIAFVGGGNMAIAIVGGLVRSGHPPGAIRVVEPNDAARGRLVREHRVETLAEADTRLRDATLVVWAVKPQVFETAAAACQPHLAAGAIHLSVMAGVRLAALARATGADRIVRAMPNTPALIGRGIAGLCASPAVDAAGRARVDALLEPTGERVWLDDEAALDAVTALSGSGPAYVFYVLEAMVAAGTRLGLDAAQARRLAVATCDGGAALAAAASDDDLAELRRRVTSPGGTTEAALRSLDADGVGAAFERAIEAAWRRARELGAAPPERPAAGGGRPA